jgi:hypothetical protein
MDLLRRPAKLARVAAALALLGVGGCLVVDQLLGRPHGPAFPHTKHGDEAGLECTNCHRTAESGDQAGMPTFKQCQLCHKEIDESKPAEHRSTALFEGDVLKASNFTKLSGEVRFSHQKHVTEHSIACADCHGDVAGSTAVAPTVRVTMAKCTSCHEKTGKRNECADCHTEIRADRAPPSHLTNWKRDHGQAARHDAGAGAETCTKCHTKNACKTCHDTEPPRDHTNYWRLRGHAVSVAVDRERCSNCHQTDSCERCHSTTAPLSHTASWGSSLDRHCVVCHLPTGSEDGCVTCHKSGAPSHALAAPKPANHAPGMNCRQCHGVIPQAPLPHPDKGDSCNGCHH